MHVLAPAADPARASASTARAAVSAARATVSAARVSVSAARASASAARAAVSDARTSVTTARASIAATRAAVAAARASIAATRAAVSDAAPFVVALTLTLTLALAFGSAGCGGPPPRALAPLPAASAAQLPPLEYRLRTGEPWTSRAALGRVIVLDAWATYCKPCRKAFPKLGRLAAAYPDAVVIGVSVDEDDAVVEAFLREVPAGFPIARDPQQTLQSGPLAMTELPTLLVIDRLGRVRFRGEPMKEADYDGLPGLIAALLAE